MAWKVETQTVISKFYQSPLFYSYEESSRYVFHPINAFHLLKRTLFISKWFPKLLKIMPNLKMNFTLESNDVMSAYHGLVELQEYYNLNTIDVAMGKVKDVLTNKIYKSKSKLSSSDIIKVALEAKEINYLHAYVEWLKAALKQAINEDKDKNIIREIKYVQYTTNFRLMSNYYIDSVYTICVHHGHLGCIYLKYPL